MASVGPLPAELARQCAQYLDLDTLKNFRLASRTASIVGAEELFHTVVLLIQYEDYSSDNKGRSANHLNEILKHEALKSLVRKVIVNTAQGVSFMDKSEDEYDTGFIKTPWSEAFRNIYRFPLMKEVEFRFDSICVSSESSDQDFDQDTEYREYYQDILFEVLDKSEHVQALTVQHIQDELIDYGGSKEASMRVRKRLTKLALMVVTEKDWGFSWELDGGSIEKSAFQDCFKAGLISHWLEPTMQQLTHLTLYCDQFWGFWPPTDLRGVHFPHLKSLSLGHWSIAHNWQVQWIASHGETLQELILDECPLVYVLKMNLDVVDVHWPEMRPPNSGDDSDHPILKQVGLRWNNVLPMWQEHLKNLKHFGMGYGPWKDRESSGSVTMGSPRMLAFEKRDELPARIERQRYIAFGPSYQNPWIKHFPRSDLGMEKLRSKLSKGDRGLDRKVEGEDRKIVTIENEHGVRVEIDEPDVDQDVKDEEALNQFLRAIGKTEIEIKRMKAIRWQDRERKYEGGFWTLDCPSEEEKKAPLLGMSHHELGVW